MDLRAVWAMCAAIPAVMTGGCETGEPHERPATGAGAVEAVRPAAGVEDTRGGGFVGGAGGVVSRGPPVRASEDRVYALPGMPILIPLVLDPSMDPALVIYPVVEGAGGGGVIPCRASLWRVGVARGSPTVAAASPLTAWLGGEDSVVGVGVWGASEDSKAAASLPIGAWVMVIEFEERPGERPGVVRVGEERILLHWVEAERSAGRTVLASAARRQWSGAGPMSGALLTPLLDSPLSSWRAQIVAGALGGGGGGEGAESRGAWRAAPGSVRVDDPRSRVLDQLAGHVRAKWEAALGRLTAADAEEAARLADRLVLGVRHGAVVAPVWPPESVELDRLLDRLLDPDATAREVIEASRVFLAAQPAGAAWVVDDAGQADALSGETIATLAVANLTGEASVCWARLDEAGGVGAARLAEELGTAPPRSITMTTALCGLPGEAGERGAVVRVRGATEDRLGVAAFAAPVRSPGFPIAPLARDWSALTLLGGGGPAARPADLPAAARVLRMRDAAGVDRWTLFVECVEATGPGAEAGAGVVRVWMGPFGRPRVVWEIDETGAVRDVTAVARSATGPLVRSTAEPALRLAVSTDTAPSEEPGGPAWRRWRVAAPLPEEAIGEGMIRLGLERVDARGRRSAWPRPMLPWQAEPGRAALDLSGW